VKFPHHRPTNAAHSVLSSKNGCTLGTSIPDRTRSSKQLLMLYNSILRQTKTLALFNVLSVMATSGSKLVGSWNRMATFPYPAPTDCPCRSIGAKQSRLSQCLVATIAASLIHG
jgi:hypothetical protein